SRPSMAAVIAARESTAMTSRAMRVARIRSTISCDQRPESRSSTATATFSTSSVAANAKTKSWTSGGPISTARLRGSRSRIRISLRICAMSLTSIVVARPGPLRSRCLPSLEPLPRIQRRERKEAGAEREHRYDRARELRPHVAREEQRLQPCDEVARRDDSRQPLDGLRHAVDLEQEPGQQEGRKEPGEQRE